ncbi:hypothetical protein C8Q72DRAFT_195309 [Fomitopsis betulina]|nr:hypothetical protein C8Q72DRAFT_195309 [Fomitopsis betulina]
MITEKAISVAKENGMRGGGNIYQFTGGRKWLRSFKDRFGIVNGVATRLGFSETDLAREKAYGRFPLDEPYWSALPDEDGNVVGPDPFCITWSELDDMDCEDHGNILVYKPRQATRSDQVAPRHVRSSSHSAFPNPPDMTIELFPPAAVALLCGPDIPSASASFGASAHSASTPDPFPGSPGLPSSSTSPTDMLSASLPLPGVSSTPFTSPGISSVPSPPCNPFTPAHASPDAAVLLPLFPNLCAAPLSSNAFTESNPLVGPFDPLDMTAQSFDATSLPSSVLPGITRVPLLSPSWSGLFMSSPPSIVTPDISSSPAFDSSNIPSPTSSSPATPPSDPLLSYDLCIARHWPSIDGDGTLPHTVESLHSPPRFVPSFEDALANGVYQPPSHWPTFENDNFFMQKYAWPRTPELLRAHEMSLESGESTATPWSM